MALPLGPHRLAHLSRLPALVSPPLPAVGPSWELPLLGDEEASPAVPAASQWAEFPRGRVQEPGAPGSPPWTLGQFTCPGSPFWSPEHRACGSQAGPCLPWAHGGSSGSAPTGSVVLVRSPGLASPWGRPLDPPSALRSSAVPPQQGPEEKLRLREAETSSRSHRCIWSGGEQGPLY